VIACSPPDSNPPDTEGLIIDDKDRMADAMKLLVELEIVVGILVDTMYNLVFDLLSSHKLSV